MYVRLREERRTCLGDSIQQYFVEHFDETRSDWRAERSWRFSSRNSGLRSTTKLFSMLTRFSTTHSRLSQANGLTRTSPTHARTHRYGVSMPRGGSRRGTT